MNLAADLDRTASQRLVNSSGPGRTVRARVPDSSSRRKETAGRGKTARAKASVVGRAVRVRASRAGTGPVGRRAHRAGHMVALMVAHRGLMVAHRVGYPTGNDGTVRVKLCAHTAVGTGGKVVPRPSSTSSVETAPAPAKTVSQTNKTRSGRRPRPLRSLEPPQLRVPNPRRLPNLAHRRKMPPRKTLKSNRMLKTHRMLVTPSRMQLHLKRVNKPERPNRIPPGKTTELQWVLGLTRLLLVERQTLTHPNLLINPMPIANKLA